MRNHGVSCAIASVAVLVFAWDRCWAFDQEQEQRSLTSVAQQVEIACGAPGLSKARIQISGGVIQRIDARVARLTGELEEQNAVLNRYNFPQDAVTDGFARLDDAIANAQADVKSKQWEYDTAFMYKSYSAGNVKKAKLVLNQARQHLTELIALKNDGGRSPASAAATSTGEAHVAEATANLSALAGFTDRYQDLRAQTSYSMGKAAGNLGRKALSIDPAQNFSTDEDEAKGGAGTGKAAP